MIQTTIRITEVLKEKLQVEAVRKGLSLNSLISIILNDYFNDKEN